MTDRLLDAATAAVDLDRFASFIANRHTVRTFLPRPIDPHLVNRLIDCARWAPNALNLQPTHFVVITDADRRRRLAHVLAQPHTAEAPVLIVFVADPDAAERNLEPMLAQELSAGTFDEDGATAERAKIRGLFQLDRPRWRRHLGKGRSATHLDARDWAVRQTLVSASVFILAANAAGLGAAPADRFDPAVVRDAIGSPRTCEPVIVVAIGWPLEPGRSTQRLPAPLVIHRDTW